MRGRRPILVHQMGKVGSRSVVDSLRETLPDARVHHLHTVTQAGLSGVRNACKERGVDVPPHVVEGERVRREILDAGIGADVITLVREPVGRNVSAFFQNHISGLEDATDEEVDGFCRRFIEGYRHTQPLTWFQREFDGVYGLTMDTLLFDPSIGWAAYDAGRFRVLLLRCESSDEVKRSAISRFLGTDDLDWVRRNETSKKRHGRVYAKFQARLRVPVSILDRLYGSTYARHFYTAEEIERFRAKWSAAPAGRQPAG
jgi:hypothetical protein